MGGPLPLALALLFLSSAPEKGFAIYFSESNNLTLSLGQLPKNSTIHAFTAHLEPDDSGRIEYSLIPPQSRLDLTHCPDLQIHGESGLLSILKPGLESKGKDCSYKVTAELKDGKPGYRNVSVEERMVTLKIEQNETKPSEGDTLVNGCSNSTFEDLICFDGLEKLELAIMENTFSEIPLARVGHLSSLYPEYAKKYTLVSDLDGLTVRESGDAVFKIWMGRMMDREEGDSYDFQLICHLRNSTCNRTIAGNLAILDQNDSPLISQDGENVVRIDFNLSLNSHEYRPGKRLSLGSHASIIARDGDTLAVNKFRWEKKNDTMGMLDLSYFTKEVNHLNNVSTILYPKIKLAGNFSFVSLWEGDYCVESELTDDSEDVLNHTAMNYIICLGWGIPLKPDASSKPAPSKEDVNVGVFEPPERQCGTGCIVLYSSISLLILLVIFVFIFVAWRRQGYKKRKSTQSAMVDPSDMELSNGFGGGNRILLPDTDHGNSVSNGFFQTNALFNPDNFFQVESKWEISRDDLILDHVLGEGEFGRVLKGVLRTGTGTMHAAVKMLKVDQTEGPKSVRQEFMAEFSLLKQLDHTNVIKLFGACTSNRGPPLLVMEYAEFGSLRSFLRRCRRIEKINICDKLDWNQEVGILDPTFRNSGEIPLSAYHVTPQEILGFAWQIAKGMAYLSDMKMVHRDLAVRNVLLTKTKMCKISDFGLTRDIYVDDAYKKKSKDRVPVKWLAPECLTDELYTSKSDVWSFGIVLWELTTMGASPYPGIQTEVLYSLLDSGYRMPKPANCSNEVYTVMSKCWAKSPSERPTFHELVFELSRLLEDGIEYLKLDIPSVNNPGYDIFQREHATPTLTTTATNSERPSRRNSSMENLGLIEYDSSHSSVFFSGRPMVPDLSRDHTYINDLKPRRDCDSNLNSSGYESPITLSVSTG